ncbi:MAG: DNA polymerase III subunit delta [Ignavibacteriales bacterium]
MAAQETIESIYNINKYLKKENYLPIYFLFGEDEFTINNAISLIKRALSEFVLNEFDFESIELQRGDDIGKIIDLAYAFPFGGGKKLLVIKNFELLTEKKSFYDYVQNPSEFAFLIITQKGKKIDQREKLYKLLIEKGYIFEARPMNKRELASWTVKRAASLRMNITEDNAAALIDFIGDEKSLIEMNLIKFSNYLTDEKEITPEIIQNLGTDTKEYTSFNLMDAIISADKTKAIEIAYSLIEKEGEKSILNLLGLLNRFVETSVKILELSKQNISTVEAAKVAGVAPYFYEKCGRASFLLNENNLRNAVGALIEADLASKTSSMDGKTILTVLISKLIQ